MINYFIASYTYNIVLEANLKGIEAAKKGITGKALDAVARDYITEKNCNTIIDV
jgi:Xaa-Pro aminopeptidase